MARCSAAWLSVLSLLVVAGCVSPPGTLEVDAGPGYRRDGAPSPMFRPCSGGDGGAIGDGGCGDGEVPMPMTDAGPPPPPCNETTFTLFAPDATSVWVSGTFLADPGAAWPTNPSEGALALTDDGAGNWTVTHLVEPIGRHLYKFIIDGTTWVHDPANENREPDGITMTGFNSVIEVCTTSCGELADFDWRDSVMYFVMVDRFRNADPANDDPVPGATDGALASGQYEGGDLAGVTEQLPYLADLGVTTVWLSAPYENRDLAGGALDARDPNQYSAYHGYWPSPPDVRFTATGELAPGSPEPEVESRIGDSIDLHALVDTAHATTGADGHGMKVLFDYVMKHVDVESGLYGAHPEWFISPVRPCMGGDWNDSYWGTRCSFTTYLPSFDYYQPAVREWSANDALWWVNEYGIDGLRLDAIKHVPFEWLTELRDEVDRRVTDPAGGRFYMVGETFTYSPDEIRPFIDPEEMLDGQFDFPFKEQVCRSVFRTDASMSDLAAWMERNDTFYPHGTIMSPFVGNHDIPRAIHFANGEFGCTQGSDFPINWNPGAYPQPTAPAPYERLALSFAVMFTNPGIPLVYYGDEIGLAGGGDPDNRRPMIWNDAMLNAHQRALRDTVSTLGRIRGENPVLGRGRRVTVSADADTWVYRMTGCGSAGASDVIVAINRADSPRSVTIPAGDYDDLFDGGTATGGTSMLAARGFRILRAQ
ncbi:MAG: alpha-amylase family glycosyl hydrolase [Myxococcota bacterium]|nr:alpha-amylase family glycosyl hydrolase [Myxococcota bacterium]